MKHTILFFFLLVLPFLGIVLVNETHSIPSAYYEADRCTRYCHSIGCSHALEKYKDNHSPWVKHFAHMYRKTIFWLGHSGTGLNYREMNLALYLGFFPIGCSLLLWGALRKNTEKND